jgi:hypothetical protein
MTPAHGVWMTRRAYVRLQAELAGLRSQPTVEVPDESMDCHDSIVVRDAARQARDTETFRVGVRGIEDSDIEVYSAQSPLGSAIIGARPGEQRTYSIPSNESMPVTLLNAVPHGLYGRKRPRPQLASPRRERTTTRLLPPRPGDVHRRRSPVGLGRSCRQPSSERVGRRQVEGGFQRRRDSQ